MAKLAGSLWVEGNELHYVDQFAREWYVPGTLMKNQVAKPGSIWIDPTNHYLMFMNEAGNQVYTAAPCGDVSTPNMAAKNGSLWISNVNNQLTWITELNANAQHVVRAHNDIALVNTHTDTHSDSPHVDSVHNDVAHNDVAAGSSHTDWHIDDPHHDFTDQSHTDQAPNPYQNFQDFSDQIYYYHPQYGHSDAPGGGIYIHGDYRSGGGTFHEDYSHTDYGMNITVGPNGAHDDFWNHTDVPHGDIPHQDSQRDSPHQDEATENFHGDSITSTPHTDVPHTDIAHGDGHTDSHADTHGDTPHTDHPILIGP